MYVAATRMDQQATEFATNTREVKQAWLGLTGFLVVALALAGFIGRNPWPEILAFVTIAPVTLLALLWFWGSRSAFDRVYTISDEGVSLSRHGQRLEHIGWEEIDRIARGNLRVISRDGRRIVFNLPPAIQREARSLIEERLKQ